MGHTITPNMTSTATIQWQSAMLTHKGNVREYNEDALLVLDDPSLWVVADGMGGHQAGDVASNLIMEGLKSLSSATHLSEFVDNIEDKLIQVNRELRTLAKKQYNNQTIGSTVVTMTAKDHFIAYLWAGDSRLYRIRDQQITSLTTDHSEVQHLINQGLLLPEDAESHPSANVITRAIGATDNLYLSIGVEKIKHDDIYILCSDGLYRDIKEDEIVSLSQQSNIDKIGDDIMSLALSREARDNITLVIAKCNVID